MLNTLSQDFIFKQLIPTLFSIVGPHLYLKKKNVRLINKINYMCLAYNCNS